MTTKINRILFDYDGTLIIHDKENEAKEVARLLEIRNDQFLEFERRLGLFFEKCYTIPGKLMTKEVYLQNICRVIAPDEFGFTADLLDQAITEKSKNTTKLANGAKETLEYLASKGYEICLFTNGFYDGQVASMKHKGIFEYFEKIYAWDDFYAKPDWRAFLRAISGTVPAQNVMIGDSLKADIKPAKTWGIYTIGINMPDLSQSSIKPDIVITNLSELIHIL